MALEQDIEFFSGDTVKIKVTITDADNANDPKNLTGAQSIIWALAKAQGKAPLVTKTVGGGITVTDAPNGVCEVLLSVGDTPNFKGSFYHEMQVVDATGNKSTVLYGAVTISADSITT
jgi:hypothetical protein